MIKKLKDMGVVGSVIGMVLAIIVGFISLVVTFLVVGIFSRLLSIALDKRLLIIGILMFLAWLLFF